MLIIICKLIITVPSVKSNFF